MKFLRSISQAAVALTACALGTASQVAAADADGWRTYTNARYGFQICYPAALLKPRGEAPNGDGQEFEGHGAKLLAFGSNNVLGTTLDGEAREEARSYLGRTGKITYRAAKNGWEVLSGDDGGGTLFYAKTFQRDDQFITFQLTYPRADAVRFNPVAARLAGCFKLTPGHF